MNNDLISREALKKAMNEEALNLSNGGRIFIENINKIIDNAPTINPLTDPLIDAYSKIMDLEFEHSNEFWITTPEGKKIYFEKKRPQGEWAVDDMSDDVICPFCNERHCCRMNFCGNCGADMRKMEVQDG